ncbi:MAG: hypothetical protein FWE69_02040 [Clostridiales bacterium]|nr:hypothetical protein [Clostridiales bacterium]
MLKYETPVAEVITFRLEDVLTASPDHGHGDDGFGGDDDGIKEEDGDGMYSVIKLLSR